jgi:nucleotide-binding universal stress UspA family protein
MEAYEIKKILVPVDFSPVSLNALETAIAICKRQHAILTVIHVVENTYVLFPPEAGNAAGTILPELLKSANESLNDLAKKLRTENDLVVNHIVQSGNPADEICRWAHHKEIDLIVMGTHGVSGLREFFMGSNAYRVVKNSPCPVITIPGDNQWLDFKKILFPIRLVHNALEKYDIVRPIIRKNGSSLLISGIVKRTNPTGLSEMKTIVESVKKKLSEDDVICGSEVHFCDNVAKQVIEISETEKPDLIVITATLDTSLKDFFLGPYTQDIVNHAKYPVLSIRPEISKKSIGMLSEIQNHFSELAVEVE